MTIRAALTDYEIPVDHRASVRAEVQRPDGTQTMHALVESEPGVFDASTTAPIQGVYRLNVIASGTTMRGLPFTREQLLSGTVVQGGATLPEERSVDPEARRTILPTGPVLLTPEILGRVLSEHRVDPNAVESCVQ